MDIDTSEVRSRVDLQALAFDRLEFSRDLSMDYKGLLRPEFQVDIKPVTERKPIEDGEDTTSDYSVQLTLELFEDNGEESAVQILARLIGIFHIEADTEAQFNHLLRYNTLAMMMPYVRSQITLLTSQPGISPLILPPIDIKKLIDGEEPFGKAH